MSVLSFINLSLWFASGALGATPQTVSSHRAEAMPGDVPVSTLDPECSSGEQGSCCSQIVSTFPHRLQSSVLFGCQNIRTKSSWQNVHQGSEAACRSQRKNFIFGNGWRRKELTVGLLLDGLTPR